MKNFLKLELLLNAHVLLFKYLLPILLIEFVELNVAVTFVLFVNCDEEV